MISKSLLLTLCVFSAICLPAALPVKWEIKLRNRQFVPPPGLDTNLQQTLKTATAFPVHGIVQLHKMASEADLTYLSEAGLYLRQFLGGTAYLLEFSNKVSSAKITNSLVRWAGLLLPEDKTEKPLWQNKIEPWAKTREGNIRVLAQFHRYVTDESAQKVLANYTPTFYRFSHNFEWAIEISYEDVKNLAKEQSVRWLKQGPDVYRPLAL